MFEGFGIWLSPLLLLPGAALLIMSTSARYAQIHNEIHHLTEHEEGKNTSLVLEHLLKRATLFRNALVVLYCSIGLFATAGVLGAITQQWENISHTIVICTTGLGIIALFLAAFFLIRESMQSLNIIKSHINNYKDRLSDHE